MLYWLVHFENKFNGTWNFGEVKGSMFNEKNWKNEQQCKKLKH